MQQFVFVTLASVAAIWLITSGAVKIARTVSRERTRRELMAYVAEKSITMQEAERLLEASERAEIRREALGVAAWDPSWERWRETVKGLMTDESKETPAAKPAAHAS